MRTNNMKLETLETFTVRLACGFASTSIVLFLLGLLVVAGFAKSSFAKDVQPRTFSSPQEASDALFQAAQKEDEPALEAILGAGKEVTSSSDEVEDKLEREQFSKKYQEMHRLVRENDGSTVLYIGAENWPFPMPLVSKGGAWYFDSTAGADEIKFRRIGDNEATAIEVCLEFAMARNSGKDDVKATSEDPITQFAESLVIAGTATTDSSVSSPFHGYYFQTVTGPSVANSSYAFGGKKKGSVVLVAYPAEYRSSGVKTFIVLAGGVAYEKDLGPDTTTLAPTIRARTSSWHWVE
jgi:hypothetical protein